jgi:mono/diheme cytochrome c family protein
MKRILINQRISTMRFVSSLFFGLSAAVVLTSCGAGGENQGLEYAPNMYHSVAYEPYSQIVDEDAGRWLTSIDYPDGHAEFFNSNKLNNRYRMNMREAPANTVSRNKNGWLPYRIGKDSLQFASTIENPLDSTAAIISEGKVLYEMYCDHCHGAKGEGNGKVSEKYNGIPNYNSDALKSISEGHIFHVITQGKGLMWAHGSQILPEDRWKIAKYVKTLQK